MSAHSASRCLRKFFGRSSTSSKTLPHATRDWKVVEVYGRDRSNPIKGWDAELTNPFSTAAADTDDAIVTNIEWKVLLEDAQKVDDGMLTAAGYSSIQYLNRTEKHLLSDALFASRIGDILNLFDVLSQVDKPSVNNFFTFCDREYRIYSVRSGIGDEQEKDHIQWTITASKDAIDHLLDSAKSPMPRRLDEIRRDVVHKPAASTDPIPALETAAFHPDNTARATV